MGKVKEKIPIGAGRELELIRDLADSKPGAEHLLLKYFALRIIQGKPPSPLLQATANLIIAKAIHRGSLPSRAKGRPKSESVAKRKFGKALEFFDLLDQGISRVDALESISKNSGASDVREIERSIEEHASNIGESKELRRGNRDLLMWLSRNTEFEAIAKNTVSEGLQAQDDWTNAVELLDQKMTAHLSSLFNGEK